MNLTAGVYDTLTGLPLFTLAYPKLGALGNQGYLKQPMQLSAYIQDKIEYDIMIINAGVRFDHFSPASAYPMDFRNPMNNPDFPGAGLLKTASKKSQISAAPSRLRHTLPTMRCGRYCEPPSQVWPPSLSRSSTTPVP